jgi:spermidine synthase
VSFAPRRVLAGIVACFFLSGATGLVYEVLWIRMLGLVFGHTVFAVTTVLTAFMAGLGLGSWAFGRLADQLRRPLRLYGLLEIGVGAFCLLVPLLLPMVEHLYLGLARSVSLGFLTFSLAQFVLVLALLLPPTTLMGATLPVLSRLFATERGTLGRRVGLLYALNTFGAVVGTALAGYVLLPALGMQATLTLAAIVNLAVGALIVLVDRRLAEATPVPSEVIPLPLIPAHDPSETWPRRLTMLGLGLAGAASMMYEVAWTRALSLALGSSTYAFTAMLLAFLLGLALGSAIFSRVFGARPLGPAAFGLLQLGAGAAALGILPAFGRMPDAVVSALGFSLSPGFVLFVQVALAVGAMLVPTLLIGAAFPCAVQVIIRGTERVARDVGRLYAVNTLGAIAGTVLAGFGLIPLLGAQNTAKVAVLLNLGIGVALVATGFRVVAPWQRLTAGALAVGGVLGLALIPTWNATVMAAGAAIYPRQYQRFVGQGGVARALADSRLVFYRDGLTATVSVHQEGPLTSLRVNGKTDASNGLDMHMQLMLGHLPMLTRPEARSALVVGLGSGVTVGAVARHPLERIDVVEIEPAVVTAAGFFRKENRDALADRRVHLAVGDARNFMLASERRWDVIVSEPSNPWIGGIATLFSEEFYALARSRLAPGGVMVQWVDGYTIRPEDLKMIVKTFRTAFPATTVWHAHGVADFILLGSADIQPIDLGRAQAAWDASPELREDFTRMGFRTPWAFLADFLLTEIETARLSLGADLNDDDRLPLEFSAPKSLYRDTAQANYRMVRAFRAAELPLLLGRGAKHMDTPGARYDLGMAYLAKDMPAEAAVQLERAVAGDPAHVPSLIALGRALQRLEQPVRGIETLQTAARLDPRSAEAQAALARAWQTQRLTERAMEAATAAVRLAPDDASTRMLLGSLLEQQGKTAEAVEQYLAARQSRPRDAQLLESLATAYTRLGRGADAVTALEAALTLRPDDPALLARLGRAYLAVNQPIPAARVLTRSVAAASQPAQTYADLGLARLGTGDPIGATVALEHAVALDPAHAGATQLLGEINAKLYGAGAPR